MNPGRAFPPSGAGTEIDPAAPGQYPPNIQAILVKPAPASALLGPELLALNSDAGGVRIAAGRRGGRDAGRLMSVAAGLALEWGQIVPTLEMKTSFLEPARPGRLLGEGRVVKRGTSVVFLEARLENADGTFIATAGGTARVVTRK